MSNRVNFIEWFDKAIDESVPSYPDDFTRDQLKDYLFEALWKRMEAKGLVPEDDSLSCECSACKPHKSVVEPI